MRIVREGAVSEATSRTKPSKERVYEFSRPLGSAARCCDDPPYARLLVRLLKSWVVRVRVCVSGRLEDTCERRMRWTGASREEGSKCRCDLFAGGWTRHAASMQGECVGGRARQAEGLVTTRRSDMCNTPRGIVHGRALEGRQRH